MPIQAPQWTDYLNCPLCYREFGAPPHSPISLGCGHTLCKQCLKRLHTKQCPFDQTVIHVELEELVVNTALLHLAGYTPPEQPFHPPCVQALTPRDREAYDTAIRCMERLAAFLKCGSTNSNASGARLSRPMQRKLITLLQCAITDEDGRGRAARAARSLGERTVTELILQHQNSQQLSAQLWAAVRARGCQFLGPAMQEEVLKLVLLALEDGSALSRKVLVMFVVQQLSIHFPQASKTSIGHVVQLLYRASCFKVLKRECDSSLMLLKEEFRTYETLRREHDTQIVQIASESGLRIAPDQWSSLLYGDAAHKSHMQSIIDKLQTPQSFTLSVQELIIVLQRNGDPAQLLTITAQFDILTSIDPSPEVMNTTWLQLAAILIALKDVMSGFIVYLQQIAQSQTANLPNSIPETLIGDTSTSVPSPQNASPAYNQYNTITHRDPARVYCSQGVVCTLVHSDEDNDRPPPFDPLTDNGNERFINNTEHPMPAPVTTQSNNNQNSPVSNPGQPHVQRIHNMPPQTIPILQSHQYPPAQWHAANAVPSPRLSGDQINDQHERCYQQYNGYGYTNFNQQQYMQYGAPATGYNYIPPSTNNGWVMPLDTYYQGMIVHPQVFGNAYPIHHVAAAPATDYDRIQICIPHPEPSRPNVSRSPFNFEDLSNTWEHNVQHLSTFPDGHQPIANHSYRNHDQQRSAYSFDKIRTTTPTNVLPSTNVVLPSNNVVLPSTNVLPATNVTLPSSNATIPSSNVSTNVTLPSTIVTLPSTNVTLPSSNVTLPPSNVALPATGATGVIRPAISAWSRLQPNSSEQLRAGVTLMWRSTPDESDQELEEELMELERRFDSEYKFTE